jgi:DNA invertase Pin-like site-specific DNA recombinase
MCKNEVIGDRMARKGRRKVTPEIIEEMKRLRKNGLSYEKIAGKLGLSVMTVYNHLKKEEKVGLVQRLKRKLGLR